MPGNYDPLFSSHCNSGCWTRELMNYLVITPDGRTEVRNWTANGTGVNTTVVL